MVSGPAGPIEASEARAEDLRTKVISYSGPKSAQKLANDPIPPQVPPSQSCFRRTWATAQPVASPPSSACTCALQQASLAGVEIQHKSKGKCRTNSFEHFAMLFSCIFTSKARSLSQTDDGFCCFYKAKRKS